MPQTQPTVEIDGQLYVAADVVEALRPHLLDARIARMEHVLAHRLNTLALGLEDLHKNHNGQACIRTAEGLGVHNIVAAEVRNPFPLEMSRGEAYAYSRGQDRVSKWAHRWVNLQRLTTSEALVDWAHSRGMRIFGAGPRATRTLSELPVDRPLMVLFGNEATGLQPETFAACDDSFQIPMHGFSESFNVSVSVGMVLADLSRRMRARLALEGATGDMSTTEQSVQLAQWCLADLRGAAGIVRKKLG
jgi:tRNA (guanosine-2'-O-)-methyltransferase